jgi:hypothetical protein
MTARGPSETRLATVDHESILQNRCFALQRGADQGVYVPASASDLFVVPACEGRRETQPWRFEVSAFAPNARADNVRDLGAERFHNFTRTQLRVADV